MEKFNINETNYEKFIFKGSLAIEGYCDANSITNDVEKIINKMYFDLKEYRKKEDKTLADKEKIVNELINIIIMLGKNNFVIYEDGGVEYNHNS